MRCVLQACTMLFESLPYNELSESEMRVLSERLGGGGRVQKSNVVTQYWFSVRVKTRREMESKLLMCNVIKRDEFGICSSVTAHL